MFTHSVFSIFLFWMTEVKVALKNKCYILVFIEDGITGFVQVNDTHLHKQLKKECRKEDALTIL